MADIVNLTSIAVGTNGEAFTVSNPGWTANTTSAPYGSNAALVTAATSPPSAYSAATSAIAGMLYDTAPGSRNITVRTRIQRFGAAGSQVIRALACASPAPSGNDYIAARFRADNWQIRIVTAVDGGLTNVMADTTVAALSAGDYADMELRIQDIGSAGSPNWQVSVWYSKNGAALAQVGTTQSITNAVFDQLGRVGFTVEGATETAGVHLTRFYAADDTAGGGDVTAPVLTSPAGAGGLSVCSGTVNTDEANGTLYAVATASATAPTALQVRNGQDHTGAAALRVVSQAVSATGVQTVASGAITGGAGTRYLHYMHEDAAGNRSAVVSSAGFSVTANATKIDLTIAAAAGLTGIRWAIFGASTIAGSASIIASGSAESFDGSGLISLDITGLGVAVGAVRYVVLTQSDGNPAQSPVPYGWHGPAAAS